MRAMISVNPRPKNKSQQLADYNKGPYRPGVRFYRPGEMRPGEMRPGDMRPGEMRPGEMRPGEMRPGEMR